MIFLAVDGRYRRDLVRILIARVVSLVFVARRSHPAVLDCVVLEGCRAISGSQAIPDGIDVVALVEEAQRVQPFSDSGQIFYTMSIIVGRLDE